MASPTRYKMAVSVGAPKYNRVVWLITIRFAHRSRSNLDCRGRFPRLPTVETAHGLIHELTTIIAAKLARHVAAPDQQI